MDIAITLHTGLVLLVFGPVFAYAEQAESTPEVRFYLSFNDKDHPLNCDVGPAAIADAGDAVDRQGQGPTWTEAGKFDGALHFDGIDDVARIDPAGAISFGPEDSFTVELWAKPTAEAGYDQQTLASLGHYKSTGNWRFYLYTKGRLGFRAWSLARKGHSINLLSPSDSLGQWHHLAFVCDRREKQIRFYLDGQLIAEQDDSAQAGQFQLAEPLLLGQFAGGEHPFQGLIDEFCVTAGAKRDFDLTKPPSSAQPRQSPEYTPAPAEVQPPDETIARSWEALEKHAILLVPAPKELALTGEPIDLSAGWRVDLRSPAAAAGVERLTELLVQAGGPVPKEQADASACEVIVGRYDQLQDELAQARNPSRPTRQGYVIDTFDREGKTVVVVAGADEDGIRYGCLTLGRLTDEQGRLLRATVRDWPDYARRVGFRVDGPGFSAAKAAIDQAFDAKFNLVWGPGFFSTLDALAEHASAYKRINDYAAQRGIRVIYSGWMDVGPAPYPKTGAFSRYCYPYKPEEGLIGHRGLAFTWSRDDLIAAKGARLAAFMRDSGASAFYLHAMDTGGRDNPENWSHRTAMDRKRFGDDRAAADANLIVPIFRAMQKQNPDVLLIAVAYPYVGSYLQYPDIADWLGRLTKLVPPEVFFCVREDQRQHMQAWKNIASQGRYVYHEPYPWSLRLSFATTGRYAATFHFDDRDVYWHSDGGRPTGWPQTWVAAEYAWNTRAPGWGWMPENYRDISFAESAPPEVDEQLLRRVTGILFGRASAEPMRRVYAQKLSCDLPGNPRQLTGANREAYFGVKTQAAHRAVAAIEAAEPNIPERSRPLFETVRKFMHEARSLNEARYRYCVARRLLSEDRYEQTRRQVAMGLDILKPFPKGHRHASSIRQDLDFTPTIAWRRERSGFLQNHKTEPIRIGVYHQGYYRGLVNGLEGIPGWEVVPIEDITQAALKGLDVMIFSAASDVGDVTEDWRANVRRFVEAGGSAVFLHNSVGRSAGSALARPVFPEICDGFDAQVVGQEQLTAKTNHPALPIDKGQSITHTYWDHLTVRPGEQGAVLLTNHTDKAVMVVGDVKEGKVVYSGQIFGLDKRDRAAEPTGLEWQLLFRTIAWSAGRTVKTP